MSKLQTRIKTLSKAAESWLSDDNEHMLRSVHKTVEEGYFSFNDIQFALKAWKKRLTREALEKWVKRSELSDEHDAGGQNVLCLHAGNLPLVGLQDALAVLLSGGRYTGKISRKDPYLLPAFLNEVKKTATWSGVDVQWSHRLDDFEGMQNDAILFAGSEQSVPGVKEAVKKFNLQKKDTEFLIRTAHFSMAYLESADEKNLEYLAEAMLRYGGKGCRSVAVVVSPVAFESIRDDLRKACEQFLEDNPQHKKPKPKLRQRFAYNRAIKRSQIKLDDFLIQEDGLELDQDFICYWTQGSEQKLIDLKKQFGTRLQSVFVESNNSSGLQVETERLKSAQQPPVYWKPDGIDTLKWLCR